jgi:glycosyltransferase involved in cell wall biosynthesis
MRVALVVPSFEVGGVETFLLRLAGAVREHGHQVLVLATDGSGEWWECLRAHGLDAECLPVTGAFSAAAHARTVARRLESQDVIVLNHSRSGQAAIPWLPERVVAVPVFHNHDEPVYELGAANAGAWNVAVAVGPKVYAEAARRVPASKLVQIRHGVHVPTEAQRAARAQWGRPLRLLYLGRLWHAQKGVLSLPEILAEVIRRGHDATLTVAGDGPDRAKLSEKFAALGPLATRVTFEGAVSHATAYDLLLSHHALVAPSFHEGLPISVLEAEACGCVPILTRLEGSTDAAILDGETGLLVPPGDPRAFAEAIAGVAAAESRWAAMSRRAMEHARARFAVEAMADAYLRLFADAAAGRYPVAEGARAGLRRRNELLTWRERVPNGAYRLARRARALLGDRAQK